MSSPTVPPRRLTVLLLVALALLVGPAVAPDGAPIAPDEVAAAKERRTPPKKPRYTVEGELRKLELAGAISAADRATWRALYRDSAARAKEMPKGTRRTELSAVVANTEEIAARRRLTAALAPSVFLTLATNREWWSTRPAPPSGSRPPVAGSPLTWQYYRGEGLQIQWLGTFGLVNALATTSNPEKLAQVRAILDEALRLRSDRGGAPTWQYLLDFGGGSPPWASGMAQVTAMQALTRATTKLGDPRYRDAALQGVELLRRAAPTGARFKRPGGDHLLLYTFTRMRVLNAFTQAVAGLREVLAATADPKVAAVYVRAERELRAELPAYDTGTWARYSIGGAPETPAYHRLSRDLLRGLCAALGADAASLAAGGPVPGGRTPPPAEPYCALAARFTQDLRLTPNGPRKGTTSRAAARAVHAPVPVPGTQGVAGIGGPAVSQP